MTDDLWAEPDASEMHETDPEKTTEQLSPAIRCKHCGELHSQCSAAAAQILRESIARDSRDRLIATEAALHTMHEGDRVAVARWLQGALERPPLSNTRTRALEPIRAVLDALWRDIYEMTPDPIMPGFDYEGEHYSVWRPHHELAEMREGEVV